jgi:hypothetical protein
MHIVAARTRAAGVPSCHLACVMLPSFSTFLPLLSIALPPLGIALPLPNHSRGIALTYLGIVTKRSRK